jgi:hypothetical protein
MKYLISPITLGQLLQEDDKSKRRDIINAILSTHYVLDTDDRLTLDDHIQINKRKRKR